MIPPINCPIFVPKMASAATKPTSLTPTKLATAVDFIRTIFNSTYKAVTTSVPIKMLRDKLRLGFSIDPAM